MTQKEITALLEYIYNNQCRLEDELEQLQSNIRFRKPTITDCVELIHAIAYEDSFLQTTTDIRHLLNLYGRKSKEGFCVYCRKCKFLGTECEGFQCGLPVCDGEDCAYEKDFAWCFVAVNEKRTGK